MAPSAQDPFFTFDIDDVILSGLKRRDLVPADAQITKAIRHGTSLWTRTGKITVADSAGKTLEFFLKVADGDLGRTLMSGEFESMTAIHNASQDFCPKPLFWGTYQSSPSIHFFLMEFIEMTTTEAPPPPVPFCKTLAELHKCGTSPNGKFGFHTTTCVGNIPQENKWYDRWQDFFAARWKRMLLYYYELRGGVDQELEALSKPFFENVIPGLLAPLEENGRVIQPSLIHGDLWCGNASAAVSDGRPLIYDASAVYAHNELGNWRPARNKFGKKYYEAYISAIAKSEPAEDFDDRNALYSTLYNLYNCNLFPDMIKFRTMVVDEMKRLIEKFPA